MNTLNSADKPHRMVHTPNASAPQNSLTKTQPSNPSSPPLDNSPMASFSDELVLILFLHLPLSECLTLARVCRRWRQLVWTHLRTRLESRFISNPQLHDVSLDEADDLFRLLRLRHRELLPLIASCLRSITSIPHTRAYLQQKKATSKFLRMVVSSSSLPICRDAIVSLSMLCCHGELPSKQAVWQTIMADPNAKHLIQHIHSPESEIEMHMLGIIGNIASDLQLQNALVKWGAIPPILRVLKKGFDLSSEHAVRVVLNFCEGERDTKESLIVNGAVGALMRHFGSDEYEMDIWRCLYRLAEGAISSEGVVSAIFQADLLRNGVLEYLRLSTNDWAFELRSMLDVHPFLVDIARFEDFDDLVQQAENSNDPIVSSQSSMIICGITSIPRFRARICKEKKIPSLIRLLATPEFFYVEAPGSSAPSSSASFVGMEAITPELFPTAIPSTDAISELQNSASALGQTPSSAVSQSRPTSALEYPGFQVRENISFALANFTEDDHLAEICSVPGFLPVLISLLDSRSAFIQEAACLLISTSVQYGNTSHKFRQVGGIDSLAMLFQQTKNERVLTQIMKSMTNLSLDFNDRNVEAMHKSSMLCHLFDYIQSENYDLLHNLTECLWCLSISDDTRTFLREHSQFPNVMKLLDSKDFEIRCNVSGMLGNLMTMESAPFWKGQNVTMMLYRHLRDFAQMVCEHVLQMLAGLCHDCLYDPQIHKDYLEDVLELFEQGEDDVSEHAAGTLTPLTCYSDICSADLAELGFLPTMVSLLRAERIKTFLPLAVLYNVIKSTHEATTFVHLRGLHHLTKLLCSTQDHDVTWVTTACFSMIIEVHGDFVKSILSNSKEFQEQMQKWLGESDNPLHQSCASWLLMFFALDQPGSDLLQLVRKTAASLLRCINQEEHAEHVLRVMARLCTLDSQYLEMIQKAGAMQAYMKAIDYEEGSFQSQNINTAILWALANMLEENEEGAESFIRLGGISCALRFLKKSASDWAKVPAAAIITICFTKQNSNGSMSQSANVEELCTILGDIIQSTRDPALKCYAASALAAVQQYNALTATPNFSAPISTTFTQNKRIENILTGENGLLFLFKIMRSKSSHLKRIAIQSLGALASSSRVCLKVIKDENAIDVVFQCLQSSNYYDMLWTCLDTISIFASCDTDLQLQICEKFVFPFKEGLWPNTRLRDKINRLQNFLSLRQNLRTGLLSASTGFGLASLSKPPQPKDAPVSPGPSRNLKTADKQRKPLPGLQAVPSNVSAAAETGNNLIRITEKRLPKGRKKTVLVGSIEFDDIDRTDEKLPIPNPSRLTPTRPSTVRPAASSPPANNRARKIVFDDPASRAMRPSTNQAQERTLAKSRDSSSLPPLRADLHSSHRPRTSNQPGAIPSSLSSSSNAAAGASWTNAPSNRLPLLDNEFGPFPSDPSVLFPAARPYTSTERMRTPAAPADFLVVGYQHNSPSNPSLRPPTQEQSGRILPPHSHLHPQRARAMATDTPPQSSALHVTGAARRHVSTSNENPRGQSRLQQKIHEVALSYFGRSSIPTSTS